MHLEVGHERVPVRDAAPAGVGRQVHAGQPERRRNERRRRCGRRGGRPCRRGRGARRTGPGPSWRAPCARCPRRRRSRSAMALRSGASATIAPTFEIAVGPAVEPMPDPRRQRVVHRGMAERALEADRRQTAVRSAEALHPDDRVGVEQGQRHRRVVEVDAALTHRLQDAGRQRVHVHLQAGGQRRVGTQAGADAAVRLRRRSPGAASARRPRRPRRRRCRRGRSGGRGPTPRRRGRGSRGRSHGGRAGRRCPARPAPGRPPPPRRRPAASVVCARDLRIEGGERPAGVPPPVTRECADPRKVTR